MDSTETRLMKVEAQGIAHGIALQIMLSHLPAVARTQIAAAAQEVEKQGLATTVPDATLARVAACLATLLRTA